MAGESPALHALRVACVVAQASRPTLPASQRIIADLARLVELVLDVVYASPCADAYVVHTHTLATLVPASLSMTCAVLCALCLVLCAVMPATWSMS